MDPLLWIAVTPQTKADQEKLGAGLQNLMTEDPSIGVRTDPFTGTTRIGGVGEHHLEIIVHRLAREFGVHASVGSEAGARASEVKNEPRRNRTYNPQIKSLLLCQLS